MSPTSGTTAICIEDVPMPACARFRNGVAQQRGHCPRAEGNTARAGAIAQRERITTAPPTELPGPDPRRWKGRGLPSTARFVPSRVRNWRGRPTKRPSIGGSLREYSVLDQRRANLHRLHLVQVCRNAGFIPRTALRNNSPPPSLSARNAYPCCADDALHSHATSPTFPCAQVKLARCEFARAIFRVHVALPSRGPTHARRQHARRNACIHYDLRLISCAHAWRQDACRASRANWHDASLLAHFDDICRHDVRFELRRRDACDLRGLHVHRPLWTAMTCHRFPFLLPLRTGRNTHSVVQVAATKKKAATSRRSPNSPLPHITHSSSSRRSRCSRRSRLLSSSSF